ncbi:MAG: ATP-binding cassette domain-containing protein [Spirochaetes bacterium]|nr:ATP-binding cassette domain-containing protein [Spirochaetota bacterium]
MNVIKATKLNKTFKTRTKNEGKNKFLNFIKPSYKKVVAVNNINFEVEKGELLAFIGPNGAGKSTTIKILTGIMYPTSGNISVLGLNPASERKKLSYRIGSVFGQKSLLWFHLPAIDSFKLLCAIYEIDSSVFNKRIDELIEIFEIREYIYTPVRKLSLGERIRCELCASLIHKPEILFLDEPTIGLDIVVKHRIRELIIRLNKEEKTTVFLTSHDVDDIEKICKRTIVINHGNIVLDESVKKMKYQYLNKKIVNIRYNERINIPCIEGIAKIKEKDYSIKLEVDTDKIAVNKAMEKLLSCGDIADITIEEKPLEDIIKAIYTMKK